MEKPDKKEEKQKAGKKKEARKEDSLAGISEQMERAFNKKMKALVKEVKKVTKKEIKEITKAARQKIRAGAAEIIEELSKTAQVESINIDLPDQKPAEITPEPDAITPPETDNAVQSTTTPAIASPKKVTSGSKKSNNSIDSLDEAPKPTTRTRKTPTKQTETQDATETE